MHLNFEDHAIYFSKNHADFLIGSDAFWIDFSDTVKVFDMDISNSKVVGLKDLKNLNNKYVTLKGIFNKNNNGHLASYSGAIENITEIHE